MDDGFHMSCEEIRFKHNVRGVSVDVLSQLNACAATTIQRILDGEDYVWTRKPVKKKNTKSKVNYVVVNTTDGKIYSSMRQAEKAEGIPHSTLSHRFKYGDGKTTEINGKRYRLYKKKIIETSEYIVVNATEGIFYPSIRAAERGEDKPFIWMYFHRYGDRFNLDGKEFHIYRNERRNKK